jgi:hypothetical protein
VVKSLVFFTSPVTGSSIKSIRSVSVLYSCDSVSSPVNTSSSLATSCPVVTVMPLVSPAGTVLIPPSFETHFIHSLQVVPGSLASVNMLPVNSAIFSSGLNGVNISPSINSLPYNTVWLWPLPCVYVGWSCSINIVVIAAVAIKLVGVGGGVRSIPVPPSRTLLTAYPTA